MTIELQEFSPAKPRQDYKEQVIVPETIKEELHIRLTAGHTKEIHGTNLLKAFEEKKLLEFTNVNDKVVPILNAPVSKFDDIMANASKDDRKKIVYALQMQIAQFGANVVQDYLDTTKEYIEYKSQEEASVIQDYHPTLWNYIETAYAVRSSRTLSFEEKNDIGHKMTITELSDRVRKVQEADSLAQSQKLISQNKFSLLENHMLQKTKPISYLPIQRESRRRK